jgi:hypothetical protein
LRLLALVAAVFIVGLIISLLLPAIN